jgi:phage terminase large subunit
MWAEDGDGRLYLYKEVYWTRRNVMEQARFLMNYCKHKTTSMWNTPRPRAIVADHDAGERSIFTQQTGLATTAAKKDIIPGIQEAQDRFTVQEDGKPRIYFLQDAVIERDPALEEAGKPCSTLEEIVGYVWAKNKDSVQGKPEKEHPVEDDDHGMDAMRYMCMKRARTRNTTRLRRLG